MPSRTTRTTPAASQARLEREGANDEIYERIYVAILEHRLHPGTKLVEERLAEIFHVSRARVREVLARMAHEQIVELMPVAARPVAEMWSELVAMLDTLQHPAMKALAKAYLSDDMLVDQLKRCPAAKSMHHAYIGGLLEHTLSLLKLADRVCPLYPQINRDIVLMGLFLHDLGKTRELAYDSAFSYTDRGELIGHIVEGSIMLHDKAQLLMREHGVRLPAGALMVLQHIILSHHGVPEFGAAKIPSTPEAILVSLLDNVDAKTTMALAATRAERAASDLGGNFTQKQWALDTKLYRPDPLA